MNVLDVLNPDFLMSKPKIDLEILFSHRTDYTKIEGKLHNMIRFNGVFGINELKTDLIQKLWLNGVVKAGGHSVYNDIKIHRKRGIIEMLLYSPNYSIRSIRLNDKLVYLSDSSVVF